jgi:hypothetical protein
MQCAGHGKGDPETPLDTSTAHPKEKERTGSFQGL